jgi:hypothetical protein
MPSLGNSTSTCGSDAVRVNPLARGFYTVKDAARLIEAGSARRIIGWLRGYPKSHVGPLLVRDFQPIDGREELSFLDLMEVRFVEHFREQGVGVRALRAALTSAREVFKDEKPLASRRIRFVTTEDRKNLFSEEILKPAAKATEDTRLWSLLTRQYEIYELIMHRLARGVVFDPSTEIANQWVPRPEQFPTILLDPKIAYGQPALPSGFPTQMIYESWQAEDEDYGAISDWYDMPLEDVRIAVAFEQFITTQADAAKRELN